MQRLDASGFPCHLAGEAPADLKARDFVPKRHRKAIKVMARDTVIAVAAAQLAAKDANLVTAGRLDCDDGASPTIEPRRVGCQIGAGLIACETNELAMALATARDPATAQVDMRAWGERGMANLTPLWLLKYLPNMLACHVTIIHNAQGPSNTITCTEASGLLSIAEATRVIRRGAADACFAGGAESKLNHMGMMRLEFARRLAQVDEQADGATVVRPYDRDAAGGVIGEMGGILILEEREAARARGARVYAVVAGVGAGQSIADGDTARESEGLSIAIESALRDADASARDIDAIVPHACGAPHMDAAEASAFRRVFSERLAEIPLITLPPNLGEGMAGAGGVAAGVGALALSRKTLPARIHAGSPEPDLRAEQTPMRDAPISRILVCTNALGGHNAALVLDAA